jgi:hypothetical protein
MNSTWLARNGCILRGAQVLASPGAAGWMIAFPVVLGIKRLILRTLQRHGKKKGCNVHNAIIVGPVGFAGHLAQSITRSLWSGIQILALFYDETLSAAENHPMLDWERGFLTPLRCESACP